MILKLLAKEEAQLKDEIALRALALPWSALVAWMLGSPGLARKTLGEMQSSRHLLPRPFLRMARTTDDPANAPPPCDTLRSGFFSGLLISLAA
jgi:hypothetical protein